MSDKKKKIKEMFRRYNKAGTEVKKCKDPCLKNGRSDRYCLKCGDKILGDLINPSDL